MENVFYSTLKALFVLKKFKFLSLDVLDFLFKFQDLLVI